MRYLLDTNICIYLIKQKPQKVLDKFRSLAISDVGISSITVAELEYGVAKSQQQEKNRTALLQFLLPLEIKEQEVVEVEDKRSFFLWVGITQIAPQLYCHSLSSSSVCGNNKAASISCRTATVTSQLLLRQSISN
jgi:tRNA(fMet)-specific endonuclease VapC